MLGLSNALETARSSLQDSSRRSAVLSRNILGVNDVNYSRRTYQSGVSSLGIDAVAERAVNIALTSKVISAVSKESFASSQADMFSQLGILATDPQSGKSLPAQFATLSADMTRLSSNTSSSVLAAQVIGTAGQLVDAIRAASNEIVSARDLINTRLQSAVSSLKDLLVQFQDVNDALALGGANGRDINDAADRRDILIHDISAYVSVRAVSDGHGRLALYTDSGLTLFEKTPREISVSQSVDQDLGGYRFDVSIDGLVATSPTSVMELRSGEVSGLVRFRDDILIPASAQLDEMARSLIDVFADRDKDIPAMAPDLPGLVTTDIPLGSVPLLRVAGVARQLKLSDFAISAESAVLLRDGGFANPLNQAYNHNSNSDAAFVEHLQNMLARLEAPIVVDAAGRVASDGSVVRYAANAGVWIALSAKTVLDDRETQAATRQYAQEQLRAVTGVNLDEETARMLEVEHSYQTTAKLIATIDSMLAALLQAIN